MIAIYSRKSKQTDRGESIGNQIELCRQYIRAHFGARDAEEARVYEDEGFSGGTLARPQFQQMMKDAATAPFRAVVVYRLDRISRSVGDFAGLIDTLERLGIGFISIREQFDTTCPMGRAMMYVSSVFSQLERETIAERIRDNMLELSRSGRWLGGVTPTGFRSESIQRNNKTICRLQPVPEELRLVRQIFDCYLRTHSLTGVEAALLAQGARTRNGRPFSRWALRGILTNPVYLRADDAARDYLRGIGAALCAEEAAFDGSRGILVYNRTARQKGGGQKPNPPERWIAAVGEHPGLIPGRDWVQIQRLLEQNRQKGCRRPQSRTALLSGTLRCVCGAYMRPKALRDGRFCYMCTAKERSRRRECSVKNCPGGVDDLVLEQLAALSEPEALARALETARFEPAPECAALRAELRETEARLARLSGSLDRCAGTEAEDYVLQSIAALHRRGEALRRALEEEQSASAPADAALPERLSDFGAVLRDLALPRRRSLVRALVSGLTWDGETARLTLGIPPREDRK